MNILSPSAKAVIEEVIQVLESAAAYNEKQFRTTLSYVQQDRANRLKAVLDDSAVEE